MQEHGEDVGLRVPEVVALVALAGQALGGDVGDPVAPGALQQVEHIEPHPLQQLVVAVHPDAAAVPEGGHVRPLLLQQRIEAQSHGLLRLAEGGGQQGFLIGFPAAYVSDQLVEDGGFAGR